MSPPTLHASLADILRATAPPSLPSIAARTDAERDRRLAVHRNTFVATLVAAHVASFPVTHQLLGDTFFRAMSRERVLTDPPRSPVLTEYVGAFPAFAATFAPLDDVAYVRDVIQLEATRMAAFHASDETPLTAAEMQPWLDAPLRLSGARVRLHSAARWLRCGSPAYSLWRAHPVDDAPDEEAIAAVDPESAEDVLVSRPCWEVQVAPLPAGGAVLLDALATGVPLADAFARAAEHGASDPLPLFTLLVDAGLIAGLHATEDDPTWDVPT